jgi:dTDP-glucose 4,6-dehydratase
MYGAFKAAGEVVGLTFSAVFGLDVRIVRAQSVYGFGMRAPIPVRLMVEGAVAGLPVHLPSGGTFPRDHTHVDDVSSLTMALVRAEGPIDRVFIPGTGRPPTTGSDVAAVVRELVPGCDVTISDAMTDAELADSVYRGRVSIENARVQLDWQPRFPDLRDGVADYIERYRRFVARGGDPTQSMETAR